MPYAIEYLPDAIKHLEALNANERAVLFDGVRGQLTYQPTIETRNRKQMRPNPLAPWELRLGSLRVYYDVQEKPTTTVGIKEGNVVRIGGKRWQL